MPDKRVMVAGVAEVSGAWTTVNFPQSVGATATVLHQVSTNRNSTPVVVRQAGASNGRSVRLHLQREEARNGTPHGAERVGYVALTRD